MYKNLRDTLTIKGISVKSYAEFLGISEKSVLNKIKEDTDFTYPEYRKTCQFLLPEYSPDYLFATETTIESA